MSAWNAFSNREQPQQSVWQGTAIRTECHLEMACGPLSRRRGDCGRRGRDGVGEHETEAIHRFQEGGIRGVEVEVGLGEEED